jgi:hypothetical protein
VSASDSPNDKNLIEAMNRNSRKLRLLNSLLLQLVAGSNVKNGRQRERNDLNQQYLNTSNESEWCDDDDYRAVKRRKGDGSRGRLEDKDAFLFLLTKGRCSF